MPLIDNDGGWWVYKTSVVDRPCDHWAVDCSLMEVHMISVADLSSKVSKTKQDKSKAINVG